MSRVMDPELAKILREKRIIFPIFEVPPGQPEKIYRYDRNYRIAFKKDLQILYKRLSGLLNDLEKQLLFAISLDLFNSRALEGVEEQRGGIKVLAMKKAPCSDDLSILDQFGLRVLKEYIQRNIIPQHGDKWCNPYPEGPLYQMAKDIWRRIIKSIYPISGSDLLIERARDALWYSFVPILILRPDVIDSVSEIALKLKEIPRAHQRSPYAGDVITPTSDNLLLLAQALRSGASRESVFVGEIASYRPSPSIGTINSRIFWFRDPQLGMETIALEGLLLAMNYGFFRPGYWIERNLPLRGPNRPFGLISGFPPVFFPAPYRTVLYYAAVIQSVTMQSGRSPQYLNIWGATVWNWNSMMEAFREIKQAFGDLWKLPKWFIDGMRNYFEYWALYKEWRGTTQDILRGVPTPDSLLEMFGEDDDWSEPRSITEGVTPPSGGTTGGGTTGEGTTGGGTTGGGTTGGGTTGGTYIFADWAWCIARFPGDAERQRQCLEALQRPPGPDVTTPAVVGAGTGLGTFLLLTGLAVGGYYFYKNVISRGKDGQN